MSPDRVAFDTFLRRAVVRARWRAALIGAAAALAAAAIAIALGLVQSSPAVIAALTATLVLAGAAIAAALARLSPTTVARRIELRSPASRNLLLTAAELLDGTTAAPAYMQERIFRDAALLASRIDVRRAVPARASVLAMLTAIGVWLLAVLSPQSRISAVVSSGNREPAVHSITATITSPAYSQLPAQTVHSPDRLTALVGSRMDLLVTADAAAVTAVTIAGSQRLAQAADGSFAMQFVADRDGFLAVEPIASDGTAGRRRLIGLSVTPDRAPTAKITAPARDMIVPVGPRTLEIALEAQDDIGLRSLFLRYTKISGSGENFDFKSADLPVTIARANNRSWTARLSWPLASLALEAGDMLVYRAVAADDRPGGTATESDAFILEIAAPGALPGEGFAIDDRHDKYAISQQMVIVKTERLLAARKSMSSSDFEEAVLDLAAEQRQVRAEFVFMMGGELSNAGLDPASLNEEEEAAGEDDLAAGRLVNQGRADLMRAIRSMSRAAGRLADADAAGALPIEKEALAFLQRAFARNRYLLRTLSERERLDLSRRLTGVLADLARDTRPAAELAPDPAMLAARQALSELAVLIETRDRGARPDQGRATAIADRLLATDPASPTLRDAAAAIAVQDLDRAARTIAAFIRAGSAADPSRTGSAALDALAGALADELRRKAGGR